MRRHDERKPVVGRVEERRAGDGGRAGGARRARAAAEPAPSVLHFETLEPRLLLSADLVPGLGGHDDAPAAYAVLTEAATPSVVFGPDSGQGDSASIELDDGRVLGLSLSGHGVGVWQQDDRGHHLTVSGSDASSQLQLTRSGGADGGFAVDRIEVQDALASLRLDRVGVSGTLAVHGGLAQLTLGNLDGSATIEIGGSTPLAVSAGRLQDVRLHSTAPITTLSAAAWLRTGAGASGLEAPSLGQLGIAGDFAADLALGSGADALVLTRAQIGGGITGGHWNVQGRAGQVLAGTTASAWHAAFAHPLSLFATGGDAAGQLAAAALQLVQIGGSANGLQLLIGAHLGRDGLPGGSGEDADHYDAGVLGRLRIGGNANDVQVLVGVDPLDGQALPGGAIGEVAIGGALSATSRLLAAQLPAWIRIGGVVLDPRSLPPFQPPPPPDTEAPTLAAALATDTGVSASDGLTRDATISGSAHDDTAVVALRGALDPADADAPLADLGAFLQPDGGFTLDPAALAALAGGVLADGAHVLRLRAQDAAGNAHAVDVAFTLDTGAPSATAALAHDTGTPGDGLTRDPSITGQVQDVGGLAALRYRLDGGAFVDVTDRLGADGHFTLDASVLATLVKKASTGTPHTLDVAADDVAGNTSALASVAFTYDNVAPKLAALGLDPASDTGTPGDRDTTLETVTLVGQTEAGAKIRLLGTDLTTRADENGAFALSGVPLALGANELKVRARDAAGNTGMASLSVTRSEPDTEAPTLAAALATDTGVSASDGLTRDATISGSAHDDTAVVALRGALDPADADAPLADLSAFLQPDGAFTLDTAALAALAGGVLADGAHVLRLRAQDAAGNAHSVDIAFTLDTQVPAAPGVALDPASDTGVSASDGLTRDATPTLQLAGEADAELRLLRDGTDLGPVAPGAVTLAALADGAYVFTATATDAAGNASAPSAPLALTLDTVAPLAPAFDLAPDADTGAPGDHTTTADTVTLLGQTEAGATVRLVGSELVTHADESGAFALTSVALALGDNPLTLSATDAAGNASAASLTLVRTEPDVVDTEAPTLSAALATDTGVSASDGLTRDATVSGQASDDTAVVALRGALDPADAAAPLADLGAFLQPDGAFTLDPAALAALAGGTLADGAHVLRLRAQDATGNAHSVDVAFTLDTQAPALALGLAPSADTGTPGDGITRAARVLLTGSTEAGLQVTLAGQGRVGLAGAGGSFQFADVALADGANVLDATTADAAGNSASATLTLTRTSEAASDAVLTWIGQALEAIRRDVTDPPLATRWLAIESLAVYDTLAAIDGTPAYLVKRNASGPVSAEAAVAAAAHRVLSHAYPAQQAALDAALAQSLAALPGDAATAAGLALGRAVADDILALRADDGADTFATYDGSTALGQWRPTGPMFEVASEPQWGAVTPFALASPDQFRPAAPPALDSAAYAESVEEVRRLGSAGSSERTAEQTQIAQFWADGKGSYTPPGHWNAIAEQIAQAQGNSLAANARLFAQLNVALADAAIACWDAKYSYGLWRPETAIANADADGNPATLQDGAWRPLLITPSFPEYVSGHSTFSSAAADILASTFGDATAFTATAYTLPGVTRSYTSFSQAAAEAGRSRIYGGIHYEFTNQASQTLGHAIADAVLARFELSDDTQAPRLALDAAPAVTASNPVFSGRVLDNLAGVAASHYQLDDGEAQPLALDAEGRFTLSTAFALDGSADGVHTLTLSAVDAAGNVSENLTHTFILATQAPTFTLTDLADGAVLDADSRFAGTLTTSGGAAVVALSYRFDDLVAMPVSVDAQTGAFDTAFDLSRLAAGAHTLALTAEDAAGNTTTRTLAVTLAEAIPLTITQVSPVDGSSEVGSTFRPQVFFSRAIDPATLSADNVYATDSAGRKLAATVVPGAEGRFAWLFFTAPMPGGDTITLHVDGSSILSADGTQALDADGDGVAGGEFTSRFSTVSLAPIPGTTLIGRVVDPGPDLEPMTFDDIRRGPDGIIHTPDDMFLNPIAHARVWILGLEDHFVFTDDNGRFELTEVPAGNVKLAIDGRTASHAPTGVFFPEMVMDLTVEPGQVNTVMGSMGSAAEQRANEDRQEVYLPRLPSSILQTVSDTEDTVIGVDATAAPDLSEAERAHLKLVVQPGSAIGEHGEVLGDVQVGISTVPPELVRDMLPPGVLQHTFDITIQAPGVTAFATPLQITFPNTFNAAPGEKLNFLSFDHTTGRLVIEGTATVSADGLSVTTDPGQGITKPGWHGLTPPGVRTDGCDISKVVTFANIIDFLDAGRKCLANISGVPRWFNEFSIAMIQIPKLVGDLVVLGQSISRGDSRGSLIKAFDFILDKKDHIVSLVETLKAQSPLGKIQAAIGCVAALLGVAKDICDNVLKYPGCTTTTIRTLCGRLE